VQAWQQALNSASESEVICATGSFFQAAELLESMENSVEKSMDNSDN
jgi:folylpolyglutamate synthase/dihydropteroate synthase